MSMDREKSDAAARKYAERGKYASALTEYEKLLADRPRDVRTLHKLADVQVRMKSYADAVASYERAGNLYELEGHVERATALFGEVRTIILRYAPELQPRYAGVWTKLASAYLDAKRTRQAVEVLVESCGVLALQRREAELEETWQRIVDLEPNEPSHHAALAEVLLHSGEPRGAAASLVAAAELYVGRGQAKECYQALEGLEECQRAAPGNLDVLALAARAFAVLGQRDKSLELRDEMERIARSTSSMARFEELLRTLPITEAQRFDDEFEHVNDDELFIDIPFERGPRSQDDERPSPFKSYVAFTDSFELESALERADALIDAGILEEARALIHAHLEIVPGNVLLLERLLEIDARHSASMRSA